MKNTTKIVLVAACLLAPILNVFSDTPAKTVPLWDGKERGMELITLGHKKVTIMLADGRTVVLGVPILVERPTQRK